MGPHRPRLGAWQAAAGALVLLVVVEPIIRMALLVRRGTHMQWGDYWWMIDSIIETDGSTRFAGFFEFQNEHPVLLAKIMLWLNLRVFDGSNITLGYAVLLVAAAQLAIVAHLLGRSPLSYLERALGLILTSFLLFSMNGSWNFYKSMSGAAWLNANLFALVAIALRDRDRSWLAALAAAVATTSYGTGLAAWVAVFAVGLVRRPRREWWRELPMLAGMAAGYLWYQQGSSAPERFKPDLQALADGVASLLVSAIRLDAIGFAWLAALVVIGAAIFAVVRGDRSSAPWVGIAAYGVVSCAFIAYGRWWYFNDGSLSRYHSLAGFFWIGGTILVASMARRAVPRILRRSTVPRAVQIGVLVSGVAVIAPIAFLSRVTDTEATRELELAAARQDLEAALLRLGLDEALYYSLVYFDFDGDIDGLRKAGQYPFSSRWDADCGLLGSELDLEGMARAEQGIKSAVVVQQIEGAVMLTAAIPAEVDPIRCILAVSPDGRVVGVGEPDDTLDLGDAPAGSRGAMVAAPDGHPSYQVVIIGPDGEATALELAVSADDIWRF